MIRSYFLTVFTKIIQPFYGTGIWNYTPFRQFYSFYQYILSKYQKVYITKYWFKMQLDGSKFIDKEIIFHGLWEKNISDLLQKELKNGDTFLDIWANIWYFTLLWSICVWDTGRVIAFEPSSLNYNKAICNIDINLYKNIDIYKMWVWKTQDTLDIYYNEDNPWASSIIQFQTGSKISTSEKIQIISLDEYLWTKKVDFIKMDIEWFEFEAILWMKNILTQKDIKLIFEYSPILYKKKETNYRQYSIELLVKLQELGFRLYHIYPDATLEVITDIEEYYLRTMNSDIWQSDILCKKE